MLVGASRPPIQLFNDAKACLWPGSRIALSADAIAGDLGNGLKA